TRSGLSRAGRVESARASLRRDDFHSTSPQASARGRVYWPNRPRAENLGKIAFRAARQTKPSAPPSLLSKGLQTGWGRRFRLPGQFFTPSQRGDGLSGEHYPTASEHATGNRFPITGRPAKIVGRTPGPRPARIDRKSTRLN